MNFPSPWLREDLNSVRDPLGGVKFWLTRGGRYWLKTLHFTYDFILEFWSHNTSRASFHSLVNCNKIYASVKATYNAPGDKDFSDLKNSKSTFRTGNYPGIEHWLIPDFTVE